MHCRLGRGALAGQRIVGMVVLAKEETDNGCRAGKSIALAVADHLP